jgi:AcrR family transcriptional regulator
LFESAGTRERLLDAAEALGAARGIRATSVRAVASRARANIAAVNYHFKSKSRLLQAVFARRLGTLNAHRLRLLDGAEAGGRAPSLEQILRAFIAPTILVWRDHPDFMRLCGRLFHEPDPLLHGFFMSQFEEIIRRFKAALTRALPSVPVVELFWRMHFLLGAMVHTWTAHDDLERHSRGLCKVRDHDELIDRLVSFGAAGLRAGAMP